MATTVHNIMTPDPISVDSSQPVSDAARTMRDKDIGNVVVVEEDNLVGILTDRDIVVRCIAAGKNPDSTDVSEVCSPNVATLSPGDSLEFAEELMRKYSVRRLPVVQQGRAIGIVSLGDLAIQKQPESALGKISSRQPNK